MNFYPKLSLDFIINIYKNMFLTFSGLFIHISLPRNDETNFAYKPCFQKVTRFIKGQLALKIISSRQTIFHI